MKVFIVDDSPLFTERFEEILSNIPGIEVVGHAGDVAGAKDSIQKLKPDVVTLDFRLPNENGLDVLSYLKKTDPIPKIIVVTNYPYQQLREKFIQGGADYFFDKSADLEEVVDVLKHLTQYASPHNK